MTTQQVLSYHNQIQELQKNGSVLIYLNRNRIEEFYKNYSPRIQTAIKALIRLHQKYFVFEEEVMKFDEQKQPVLLEGADKELFQKEQDEFFASEISPALLHKA